MLKLFLYLTSVLVWGTISLPSPISAQECSSYWINPKTGQEECFSNPSNLRQRTSANEQSQINNCAVKVQAGRTIASVVSTFS
jgi:hypothetical protein